MAYACWQGTREPCVVYAAREIRKPVLQKLHDEGIDFVNASRGAIEYDDNGLRLLLLECMERTRAMDRAQGWARQGDGASAQAVRRLGLALLSDRSFVTGKAQPSSWEELEGLPAPSFR